MTKFRLIKRARGWVIQQMNTAIDLPEYGNWIDRRVWPFRFLASMHLTLLREMNRK